MKTITKFLRPVLPVIAVMLFCTASIAQVAELTAQQSGLQAYIASATARISNPSATAGMTTQELNAFQAEISTAQAKLASVNDALLQLSTAAAAQQAVTQRQADETAYQQAVAQRQAAYDAQQLAQSQQLAHHANQQLSPQKQAALSAPPKLTVDPNSSFPNMIPLFQSTGNPQQDAQIIRTWLANNPYIR